MLKEASLAVSISDRPVANPLVVLREEFDDWAVLFDPDSGNAIGLNPMGVFIWKCLNGNRTIRDILKEVHENCEGVPNGAEDHINQFIQGLVERGLAGYETHKA
jgi:SynChlorMet cassette protein ScmD